MMVAEYLYRNPRILLLAVVVIIVAGVSSWLVLPQLEDPVLGRRVGIVSTAYPGADAAQTESLVTRPLEEGLEGLADIRLVRSNSQSGISNIVIELQDDVTDVEPVWSIVRDRIADTQPSLPAQSLPSQLQVVPLKAFAALIAVTPVNVADGLRNVRKPIRELRRQILAINGTELVETFGDPGAEFVAEIEPETLATLNLSVAAVASQLKSQLESVPTGRIQDEAGAVGMKIVSTEGRGAIENATIVLGPRGEFSTLGQIAEIRQQSASPPQEAALIDGRRAIVIGAMVDDSMRIDQWNDSLAVLLSDFRESHRDELQVSVLFSQADHVRERMKLLLQNLGMGIAAVTAVVFILMGWRCMLVVSIALPLASLMVLAAMRVLQIPIHQMSVTGLIVALGLLIDNAIVIVEDVRSRIIDGQPPRDAITSAIRHLRTPLFGSTLTTALAFLPIATLPGPPGEFVGTIAVSVILAISSSFLLSMTIIPALIALLKIDPTKRGFVSYGLTVGFLQRLYEGSLKRAFRFPVLGVLIGLILPVLGFLAARSLPEQFFPPSDRLQIQIEVELPATAGLSQTTPEANLIRNAVSAEPEVLGQHWFVGRSAPTFYYNVVPRRRSTPYYAQAFIDLQHETDIEALVQRLQRTLNSDFTDSRILVRQLEQGPPFDAPIEVRLAGPETGQLRALGRELRTVLAETPNVIHTRSDLEETVPRMDFLVDEDAAADAGLTATQVGQLIYTSLEGMNGGHVTVDGDEIPVQVRLALDANLKYEQVLALPLSPLANNPSSRPVMEPAADYEPVTLARLGEATLQSDVGAIVRIDGERVNEVKAYIDAGILPSVALSDFKRRLEESDFRLPAGYSIQFGGETEQRTQAVNRLIANGVVLFSLMLLTLVVSFLSFRCAAIIAAVGGLSVGLGPLALAANGYPFGFMAIVGTMGLIGVAINDSIVVLAAIRADERARAGDREQMAAVVSHCTRHIVATTLTTIVGFLPLILSGGGFWPPLAVTIAGGVGGATLLALYVVPAMHILSHRRGT
ncbi:MAG: efflux RND transporter permease subunit [Fuerstiella sp.]